MFLAIFIKIKQQLDLLLAPIKPWLAVAILSLSYWLAIAPVATVAKLFEKSFLNFSPQHSTWQTRNKDSGLEKPY